MSCVISSSDSVSPEWLTQTLRQAGCLREGQVVSVHVTTETSYTATLARLKLTYSEDTPATMSPRLFLKILRADSKQTVVGASQRRREVNFYNQVTPLMTRPPIVRCYQAVFCEETSASHILFDDVAETHFQGDPFTPPPVLQSEKTMDAFAEWHAFWWDHRALGNVDVLPTRQSVQQYIAHTREQFPRFADVAGHRLSRSQRQVYEKALAFLPRLWERVALGKQLTLIHGDANFSNVLLPRDPEHAMALIIDWQLWGISFAAEDLAHLMALFWNRDDRQRLERRLLLRYHQGLVHHEVENYTWTDCWNDYRLAVILRVLFMPMWFCLSGSSESWWQGCLERAFQAVEDLRCLELLEMQ